MYFIFFIIFKLIFQNVSKSLYSLKEFSKAQPTPPFKYIKIWLKKPLLRKNSHHPKSFHRNRHLPITLNLPAPYLPSQSSHHPHTPNPLNSLRPVMLPTRYAAMSHLRQHAESAGTDAGVQSECVTTVDAAAAGLEEATTA